MIEVKKYELEGRDKGIWFDNCQIINSQKNGLKNFEGLEYQYNPAGKRNFRIIIDDERLKDQLIEDGWNLSILKGDEPTYILKVQVVYPTEEDRRDPDRRWKRAPLIKRITRSGTETMLDEEEVKQLDKDFILRASILFNPSDYSHGRGPAQYTGYLQEMVVEVDDSNNFSIL